MPEFHHTDVLPLGPDDTTFRLLDLPPGRVVEAAGRTFLEIAPSTITALVRESVRDIQHMLRPSHLAQLRSIVDDPEASPNDRFVATDLLRNACVSAGGVLPMCQDTGTATSFRHACHVAGIIAAIDNSIGTVGVAPRATIIGLKALHLLPQKLNVHGRFTELFAQAADFSVTAIERWCFQRLLASVEERLAPGRETGGGDPELT